jgi:hypothetical protein
MNASATGLKTIPSTSTGAERETSVIFEASNVAVSSGPLGTVLGVQLAAVFQSPLVGLRFQVALPAAAFGHGTAMTNAATTAGMARRVFIDQDRPKFFRNVKNNDPPDKNLVVLVNYQPEGCPVAFLKPK